MADMGYLVAHFRKVKTTAGLANVANHNSRFNVYDDAGGLRGDPPPWLIHLDRAKWNDGQEGRRDDSILRIRDRTIQEANLGRKPQKNAAAAIEVVFTASPGSLIKAADWKAFFKDCRSWVDRRFHHENVIQWNEHFDEKTPHLHILMLPIVRDPHKNARYSSSEYLGGPEGLRSIQNDLHAQIGAKYGLERGIEGSEARHTDQDEWKRELKKKEIELQQKEYQLKILNEHLTKEWAEIKELEARTFQVIKKSPEEVRQILKSPENLRKLANAREKDIATLRQKKQKNQDQGFSR
jgi:hypothetical protein